jgi:DNA-nicking Smr family endonuclease
MYKTKHELTEQDKKDWENWSNNIVKQHHKKTILKQNHHTEKNNTQKFNKKLDLHGMTINTAFLKVQEFIDHSYIIGNRELTIVTGKSGQISKEFASWISGIKKVAKYKPIIDTKKEIGSYRIWLIKKKTI